MIGFALFLVSALAQTKEFKSKFIQFDLPRNWSCQKEDIDWVCQPDNVVERTEAIVVVVRKQRDPVDDTFKKFKAYLGQQKSMIDLSGKSYRSQVKYLKTKKIQGHEWVDSLQTGSEIPNFYSRYLVTTKEKITGMISYHVAESVWAKWAEPLSAMADSAVIRFDENAYNELVKTPNAEPLFGSRPSVSTVARRQPVLDNKSNIDAQKESSDGLQPGQMIALAFLLGGIGFFVYHKKKNG